MSRSSPSLVGSLVTVRPLSLPFYLRHLLTVSHTRVQTDLGWLSGDVIAGLTVGIVGVPQSMSYAQVNAVRALFHTTALLILPAALDRYTATRVRSLLFIRRRFGLLCKPHLACLCAGPPLMSLMVVLRYLQGCLYRPRRSHVPHRLSNHCIRQRAPSGRLVGPANRYHGRLHLRFHRVMHRSSAPRLASRVHPCSCCQRFHDRVRA